MINTEISLNFSPDRLYQSLERDILNVFSRELNQVRGQFARESYRDSGELARAWEAIVRLDAGEVEALLQNLTDHAENRVRGREPGKMPPISAIASWARKRGLNPYAVAKVIGDIGTQRYREDENFVGLDRNGELKRSSPIVTQLVPAIRQELNRMRG